MRLPRGFSFSVFASRFLVSFWIPFLFFCVDIAGSRARESSDNLVSFRTKKGKIGTFWGGEKLSFFSPRVFSRFLFRDSFCRAFCNFEAILLWFFSFLLICVFFTRFANLHFSYPFCKFALVAWGKGRQKKVESRK